MAVVVVVLVGEALEPLTPESQWSAGVLARRHLVPAISPDAQTPTAQNGGDDLTSAAEVAG